MLFSKTVCLQACLLAPTLHTQGLTYQKAVSAISEPSQQLSTPDADAEEPTGFLFEHPSAKHERARQSLLRDFEDEGIAAMYNMANQFVSLMASPDTHARQISSLALMAIAQDGHLDMHGLDDVESALKVLKSQSDAEETRYAVLAMMVELHKQRQLPLELLLQHNAQEQLAMLLTTGVSCPYYIFCHVWRMHCLQLSSLYQKSSGACQPGRCLISYHAYNICGLLLCSEIQPLQFIWLSAMRSLHVVCTWTLWCGKPHFSRIKSRQQEGRVVSADELAEPAGYLLPQLWDLQPSPVSDFVSKRHLQPVLERLAHFTNLDEQIVMIHLVHKVWSVTKALASEPLLVAAITNVVRVCCEPKAQTPASDRPLVLDRQVC